MTKLSIDLLTEASKTDKFLKMYAKDIMQKYPVTLSDTTSIKSAISILANHKLSSVCVTTKSNNIIGIISEHDLLIQSASQEINNKITYIKDVIAAKESDSLKDVLIKVLKNKLKIIPIVNSSNTLVGTVSRIDLLKELTDI